MSLTSVRWLDLMTAHNTTGLQQRDMPGLVFGGLTAPSPWARNTTHQPPRRICLIRAAGRSAGSGQLQAILQAKLGAALDSSGHAELLQQGVAQELPDAQEIEAGLDKLLLLFSAQEAVRLLQQQPLLLAAPVGSWLEFLEGYGLNPAQVKNLVATCPQLLVKGDPATAGAAIMHLQSRGFDNQQVIERAVAYCPQVLMMGPADIDTLVRLWDKFRTGVDEQP